ncbi:hypothetical protein RJ639_044004 [Escallonia herrerae]|uniref:Uncharacterized protein n=1 Tax=Escallonia herrerae TaxID=1293975 RepID=A0AA88WBU0_9ASTE|nr:hypothetical protein RJ639_044004 [Escallonia herrerae]
MNLPTLDSPGDLYMEADAQRSDKKRLVNKVAVITGGARGIGAATAKLFAENGAHVVVADVLDELGKSLADSIGGQYIHCDVANEADVESAVQLALVWKGKLDIMFNSAGISGPGGSITNLKMEEMSALLSINVNGVVHGIKHASRAMIGKGGGSIVCTSSSAAIMGGLASHAYTLSKEAILGGKFLRKVDMRPEEVGQIVGENGSLLRGRSASVDDMAQAVLFLARNESGFVTAHNLVVDGGLLEKGNIAVQDPRKWVNGMEASELNICSRG